MSTYLLGIFVFLSLLLTSVQAQESQPVVNCTTVDQCRVLVLVLRVQLQTAQESWAFWASHADTLQKQLDKLQKEQKTLEQKETKDE